MFEHVRFAKSSWYSVRKGLERSMGFPGEAVARGPLGMQRWDGFQ